MRVRCLLRWRRRSELIVIQPSDKEYSVSGPHQVVGNSDVRASRGAGKRVFVKDQIAGDAVARLTNIISPQNKPLVRTRRLTKARRATARGRDRFATFTTRLERGFA